MSVDSLHKLQHEIYFSTETFILYSPVFWVCV